MGVQSDMLRPLVLPRRMMPTDTLFWYAESALPIFRPVIGGLFILDRTPDRRKIEAGCDAAVALVPRLRQRVVEAPLRLGLPEWAEDPHFDRAYHLRHLCVPQPGRMRDLLDLVATLFATPLDRERPLWEAYVIDGLRQPESTRSAGAPPSREAPAGKAAYFFKLHHSVVDGVGSIALLNCLTQRKRRAPVPRVVGDRSRRRSAAPTGDAGALWRLAIDDARSALGLLEDAAAFPLRALAHPVETIQQVGAMARGMRGVLADVRSGVVHDPLARSASGLSRRLDVMEIPFERLRRISTSRGVTINDVVLAALTATLRAYHRERKVKVRALNCMVPMNLRGREESDVLGNRVGLFNVVLPLDEKQAERRLARIVAQTRRAKRDQRGSLYPFLARALTLLPGEAFGWLARQCLGRVNVACTNIPGVRERRFMAGAEVLAIYPFASVVQGTPLVMALLSYGDAMEIGIDTDPEAIPDPHRIAELFGTAIDELDTTRLPS